MGALSEMSLEPATAPIRPGQVVLSNVEINNKCSFSAACGDHCYLNLLRSGTKTLPDEALLEATIKLMRHGAVLRHLVVAGKEPFESPELLMRIAIHHHEMPFESRAGSLGVISASAQGIRRCLPQMRATPLSWLAVSVDTSSSGLRAGNPFRVLDAALAGKEAGGTDAVAVNTTFQKHTLPDVKTIGEALRGKQVDQWTTSALMLPTPQGIMTSTVDLPTTLEMIAIAETLIDVARRVVVETTLDTLRRIMGESRWSGMDLAAWRLEFQLPSGVWLFARAPVPGYFLRVRHDGALLSKEDFTKVGLTTGRYGKYTEPADIDRAMATLLQERIGYKTTVIPAMHSLAAA